MKISARNMFPGTVKAIKAGSVNSEVSIEIAPGIIITAVITKGSVRHLGLKKGAKACAVVKASSVLVAVD